MKIAIVSDAWRPQINGVVTTLSNTVRAVQELGHEVELISGVGLRSIACPSYPEVRLALFPGAHVRSRLRHFSPDAIHIATEGPLGLAARAHCSAHDLPFTTSYHTQFPDYVEQRWGIPAGIGYAVLRRFHRPAQRTLVSTETVRNNLHARGFQHLALWSRGVNTGVFHPDSDARGCTPPGWPRPLMLYAGRVAVEKNLDAFLALDMPGTKVVVGDGPALPALRRRYPGTHFLGYRFGADLAREMAAADVFVFPSRTDTFGVVMLEAMACGVPVAAFPVQGPLDVVRDGVTGSLHEDLAIAIRRALQLDPAACFPEARQYSWERCTRQFIANLAVGSARIASIGVISPDIRTPV